MQSNNIKYYKTNRYLFDGGVATMMWPFPKDWAFAAAQIFHDKTWEHYEWTIERWLETQDPSLGIIVEHRAKHGEAHIDYRMREIVNRYKLHPMDRLWAGIQEELLSWTPEDQKIANEMEGISSNEEAMEKEDGLFSIYCSYQYVKRAEHYFRRGLQDGIAQEVRDKCFSRAISEIYQFAITSGGPPDHIAIVKGDYWSDFLITPHDQAMEVD